MAWRSCWFSAAPTGRVAPGELDHEAYFRPVAPPIPTRSGEFGRCIAMPDRRAKRTFWLLYDIAAAKPRRARSILLQNICAYANRAISTCARRTIASIAAASLGSTARGTSSASAASRRRSPGSADHAAAPAAASPGCRAGRARDDGRRGPAPAVPRLPAAPAGRRAKLRPPVPVPPVRPRRFRRRAHPAHGTASRASPGGRDRPAWPPPTR